MFKLKDSDSNKFKIIHLETQKITSAMNIFYHNIRMLRYRKYKYITYEDYKEYYDNILSDIELQSSPLDLVMPNNNEYPEVDGIIQMPEDHEICMINETTPEYARIRKRVTIDDIKNTFPPTHAAAMAILDNPSEMTRILDEVVANWIITRYLAQIEMGHLQTVSVMTPIMEYVCENVTIDDIKNHITSKKINMEKVAKHINAKFNDKAISAGIFIPDLSRVKKFYVEDHDNCPVIDVEDLINRLISNIVLSSDMYIISGIYHILSFCMADFVNDSSNEEQNPCIKYVREVLSQI